MKRHPMFVFSVRAFVDMTKIFFSSSLGFWEFLFSEKDKEAITYTVHENL